MRTRLTLERLRLKCALRAAAASALKCPTMVAALAPMNCCWQFRRTPPARLPRRMTWWIFPVTVFAARRWPALDRWRALWWCRAAPQASRAPVLKLTLERFQASVQPQSPWERAWRCINCLGKFRRGANFFAAIQLRLGKLWMWLSGWRLVAPAFRSACFNTRA